MIDSHAHLDMAQFDSDRTEVIQRARETGVELILTVGTGNPDHRSPEDSLKLIEEHDLLYGAIGVHPHDARAVNESYFNRMRDWARHPKIRLWGEIGLDYFYDYSPRETQKEVFRIQLQIARALNLPVTIHCRDSWPDLIAILEEECRTREGAGILHSFTGTSEQAQHCIDLGFLISFSGMITFKNAGNLRETARQVPLDKTLIETDCPYLAPVPHRGKRNEPAFVAEVARALAELHGVDVQRVTEQTAANFRRLCRLEPG